MTMGGYEPNDSRKVTQGQKNAAGQPGEGTWRQQEAQDPREAYEPTDSRRVTAGQERGAAEPGEGTWRQEEAAEAAPLPQANNAQEATGGTLPDPERAEDFDQDEA